MTAGENGRAATARGRGTVAGVTSPAPLMTLLPGIYRDDDLSNRFTEGLDEVLAPVIVQLDCLQAYVDPRLAPVDFLAWLGAWVGVEVDPAWPERRRRELVGEAGRLWRRRGTVGGLRELLRLSLDVEVEILDGGGVSWSQTADSPPPRRRRWPDVVVRLTEEAAERVDLADVEAVVASCMPAHLPFRVEVRG